MNDNRSISAARVAATPKPPYYTAITTAELAAGYDAEAHRTMGVELYRLAQRMTGFLGIEIFFEGRASVALSYWSSLEAIDTWRNHPLHSAAKNRAKAGWFGPCITRIARVERDYGFNLRENGG